MCVCVGGGEDGNMWIFSAVCVYAFVNTCPVCVCAFVWVNWGRCPLSTSAVLLFGGNGFSGQSEEDTFLTHLF